MQHSQKSANLAPCRYGPNTGSIGFPSVHHLVLLPKCVHHRCRGHAEAHRHIAHHQFPNRPGRPLRRHGCAWCCPPPDSDADTDEAESGDCSVPGAHNVGIVDDFTWQRNDPGRHRSIATLGRPEESGLHVAYLLGVNCQRMSKPIIKQMTTNKRISPTSAVWFKLRPPWFSCAGYRI